MARNKNNKNNSKNPSHQSDPSSHNNKSMRQKRAQIAKETLEISQNCCYVNQHKNPVQLYSFDKEKDVVEYSPFSQNNELSLVQEEIPTSTDNSSRKKLPRISVHNMGTIEACANLYKKLQSENVENPSARLVALNFASSRNPGGGFLKGSMAQEESLSLCSNLYDSIHQCKMYSYHNSKTDHRRHGLYNHFVIFSKRVSVFRNDRTLQLLDSPFEMQFVSSPAVNAGVFLKRFPDKRNEVESTMKERMRKVLRVCRLQNQTHLVLGAYGCGVFRNNATFVAKTWMELLNEKEFEGCFEEVVFAILGDANLGPFEKFCLPNENEEEK